MSGILLFSTSVVVIALLAVAIYVKSPAQYFKTKDGRGVLFGIAAATGAALSLALFVFSLKSEALEYFQSGEVFIGLDQTIKISPMCSTGPNDDRLTSNLGFRASVVSSDDKRASINFKYTHHSCAVNPDSRSYDATGVEVIYRAW